MLRVLFHPKQLMLFTSDDQGEVRVWDLVTKAPAFKNMTKVGVCTEDIFQGFDVWGGGPIVTALKQ